MCRYGGEKWEWENFCELDFENLMPEDVQTGVSV